MLCEEVDPSELSLDELVEQQGTIQDDDDEDKQQLIEENLKQIKFFKSKLRFAQEQYYAQNRTNGRSPLTRLGLMNGAENIKAPVHMRLGKRRLVNVGTDTLLPKSRRILRVNRRDITLKGNAGKSIRLFRSGQAQLRLERIRRQQAEALQNLQLIQPVNKFRLRRRKPNGLGMPFQSLATNYMIEIPNNTYVNANSGPTTTMHSIDAELDADIQTEIMRIQMIHSHPQEAIASLPPLPIMTRITLDDRFSSLP